MNAAELVQTALGWIWANPWSIALALVVLLALAFGVGRSLGPQYFYDRGLRRCSICLDGSGTRNKVVYDNRATAAEAAVRYRRKFGSQWPYRAPCGYWHLTSQKPAGFRRRPAKR